MLSINTRVTSHIDHREHAWALRTIGQDLAKLRPQYLEIEFTGQLYIAKGRMQPRQAMPARNRTAKLLARFRRAGKPLARTAWFERSYPLSEIRRLDDDGLMRRKNFPEGPDIYVLGERLRTIGRMIEANGGQLIKCTMDNHRVTFTFRDRTGAVCNQEHSNSTLYLTQQDGHGRRGTGRTRDPWQFSASTNPNKLSSLSNRKFKLATAPASKKD